MKRAKRWVIPVVAVGTMALLAWPVYAHCGKCAGSCKDMQKKMEEGKVTLSSAITAAETACKGKAMAAVPHMDGGKVGVSVYCLAGEKLVVVEVDGTGKAGEAKDAAMLPGEAPKPAPPKPGG
ncbi:MAG: hypothetical protein HY763_07445 [Planctomycetes bacterium]|nr:hypothetical protein [Planctomycetota bacterium]